MVEEPEAGEPGSREGEREWKTGQEEERGDERRPDQEEGEEEAGPPVDEYLRSIFQHSVDEGVARLSREWPDLLATGTVGGIDVSLGILALLVIEHATGSTLLGALGFTIGFIALTLGKSELFTENFLVPVAALTAGESSISRLFRLWGGTAVMNLVGGWIFAALIVAGAPHLAPTAVEVGTVYTELSWLEASALGVIAGVAITFMTWMEHGARSELGRIVAVASIAFLLAAVPLNHVIVVSLEMFVAIQTGQAPFGYVEWARVAGIATVTNMVGGLLLVTVLRLVQVGRRSIEVERLRARRRSLEERGND